MFGKKRYPESSSTNFCVVFITAKKGEKNMKSTGIVRNIDNMGRLVLPIELRKLLKLEIKAPDAII